jgi:hypothetical protein
MLYNAGKERKLVVTGKKKKEVMLDEMFSKLVSAMREGKAIAYDLDKFGFDFSEAGPSFPSVIFDHFTWRKDWKSHVFNTARGSKFMPEFEIHKDFTTVIISRADEDVLESIMSKIPHINIHFKKVRMMHRIEVEDLYY